MPTWLKITLIGCGGLLILLVLFIACAALLAGIQGTTPTTPPEESRKEERKDKAQSASPAKDPSPAEEPEPISLSGNGQTATEPFELESGLVIFEMTHQGDGHFSGTLLDQNGQQAAGVDSLLANVVGPFDGSRAAQAKAGRHVIDISASGPWTITIEQPRPSSASQTTNFTGNSQAATDFFQLSEGLKTFEMTHQGGGHFSVALLDANGAQAAGMDSLVANDVGPFDGSKAVRVPKGGIYLLQVDADGPWSVQAK